MKSKGNLAYPTDVGNVEVVLFDKKGNVLASIRCSDTKDAAALLRGVMGLTVKK